MNYVAPQVPAFTPKAVEPIETSTANTTADAYSRSKYHVDVNVLMHDDDEQGDREEDHRGRMRWGLTTEMQDPNTTFPLACIGAQAHRHACTRSNCKADANFRLSAIKLTETPCGKGMAGQTLYFEVAFGMLGDPCSCSITSLR